ncbi:Signal transduction histidine kinase, contains PAS domain [Halapricum desulfuricans]|uniref:Signal transduction histidine kinase, contains PAS domain n=1 Tax=Halapricum desulfuricans TaxID=2841257 RepID=A0A897NNA1_9EURY|nr:PAS domain-containing protein [Halapricum desulfuricans]QSG11696.1 Signal transduction histidine kinase, contains PAS domain [Halapricum desulfuricans]
MVPLTALRLGTAFFATLVAVTLVAVLLRHRERASARALLGVGAVTAVGSLLHLLVADLTPPNAALTVTGWEIEATAWVVVGTTVAVIASGLWVLFAFRYTGRSQRVIQVTVGLVAGISFGAVGIATAALGDPSTLAFQLLTVTYLLVGFLVTIGVFLLIWMSIGQQTVPYREPLLLSAGAIVLLSGSFVAQIVERPILLPAFSSVASGVFLIAVIRYPVFETAPAARVLGRDRVVDELADGILIVDRRGRLRDLNPAAERLFDVSRASAVGQPIKSIIPTSFDPGALTRDGESHRVKLSDGTTISVTADPVTDGRDRSFGYLVRCTDVTNRRRQEEQLTLLSRFVVEVIDERMAAVAEEATRAGDSESVDSAAAADQIWERTTRLTNLVAQTRSIEQIIAENGVSPGQELDICPVLRELRDSIAAGSGPRIELDVSGDPIATTVSPALLTSLLEPVLEDAYDHAETRVDVSVDRDSPAIRIVADWPDATDLGEQDYDAQLPLAVTRLEIDQLGGHLSVERTDDGRRAVVVALPTNDTREARRTGVDGGAER